MMAWWARLFERIWTMPSNGPVQAFATSVSFNDADFQRLMLNEKAIEIPALPRRVAHKGPEQSSDDLEGRKLKRLATAPVVGHRGMNKVALPAPVLATSNS